MLSPPTFSGTVFSFSLFVTSLLDPYIYKFVQVSLTLKIKALSLAYVHPLSFSFRLWKESSPVHDASPCFLLFLNPLQPSFQTSLYWQWPSDSKSSGLNFCLPLKEQLVSKYSVSIYCVPSTVLSSRDSPWFLQADGQSPGKHAPFQHNTHHSTLLSP